MCTLFQVFLVLNVISTLLSVSTDSSSPQMTSSSKIGTHAPAKLRYQDVWSEQNDSVVLNCSLRVNRDQHVVWHRKYDKMGVHVLTIESETFISDLRIRPVKQIFEPTFTSSSWTNNSYGNGNSESLQYYDSQNSLKLTWNLEIRRLKKEDSAFYYCVLNSENAYGQIYKLNVLPHLTMLNNSEISLENYLEENGRSSNEKVNMLLVCQYGSATKSPNEQIRWYFNKYRIRSSSERKARLTEINNTKLFSSDFEIFEHKNNETNTTTSRLYIKNLSLKNNNLLGRYKCQVKGISKTIRIFSRYYPKINDSFSLIQQQHHHHQISHDEQHFLTEQITSSASLSQACLLCIDDYSMFSTQIYFLVFMYSFKQII